MSFCSCWSLYCSQENLTPTQSINQYWCRSISKQFSTGHHSIRLGTRSSFPPLPPLPSFKLEFFQMSKYECQQRLCQFAKRIVCQHNKPLMQSQQTIDAITWANRFRITSPHTSLVDQSNTSIQRCLLSSQLFTYHESKVLSDLTT